MIVFVIPRGGEDYYKMIEQYNWLSERCGQMTYDMKHWELGWHDSGDDWAQIRCYDESIATLFKLAYPEVLTLSEWETFDIRRLNRRWNIL